MGSVFSLPVIILVLLAAVIIWARRTPRKTQVQKSAPRLNVVHSDPPIQSTAHLDVPIGANEHRDSWEGSFWDASVHKNLLQDIVMTYEDGNGQITKRAVSMRAFDDDFDLFVGHCHLRNATRTFRFSRIIDCADGRTGEVIPDFKEFCLAEYAKTPDHSADLLIAENLDAMQVAIFVGRRDGRLTKKELSELAFYASDLIGDDRIDAEMMRGVFNNLGEPSITAFRRAVGRLKSTDMEYRRKLISACKAMVATESKVSQSEQEALDYLDKNLGEGAIRSR